MNRVDLIQFNRFAPLDETASRFVLFFLPVGSSLLTPLWNNSVKILYQVATQHPQQGGLMVFCQRLLYTLQVCQRKTFVVN